MKKTANYFRNYMVIFILIIYCLFFVNSCGLEEYYYLDPPVSNHTITMSSSSSYADTDYYYLCNPLDNDNNGYYSSPFEYEGTTYYYKIYNSLSAANSVYSKVSSYNNSSTSTTAGIEYLLSSSGANYKELYVVDSNGKKVSPVTTTTDYTVYIRLASLGNESETTGESDDPYQSVVALYVTGDITAYNSDENYSAVNTYYPKRSINSNYGFDFSSDDSKSNPVPDEDDDDVYYSSSSDEDEVWYVEVYAVSYGVDTEDYTYSYSTPTFLGIIKIDEDNYESS